MSTQREPRLEGGGLRVQFVLGEDRYAHEVWVADGSAWTCVARSVEGSPQEVWPASPPLQSLHLENRPHQRQLALLVGMAGKNHWSASIELDPLAAQIHCDIACRVRGAARGPLASRYQMLGPPSSVKPRSVILATPAEVCQALHLALDERFGDMRLESDAGSLNLIAAPQPSNAPAETIRWGYTLSLTAAAPRT